MPGGEEIEVTDENKGEWVRAVCEWRLFGCNRAQCAALLRGSGGNIVKVALSNSIGFALYETAKDTLGVDGRKPPWVKKREAASRRGRGAGGGGGRK